MAKTLEKTGKEKEKKETTQKEMQEIGGGACWKGHQDGKNPRENWERKGKEGDHPEGNAGNRRRSMLERSPRWQKPSRKLGKKRKRRRPPRRKCRKSAEEHAGKVTKMAKTLEKTGKEKEKKETTQKEMQVKEFKKDVNMKAMMKVR